MSSLPCCDLSQGFLGLGKSEIFFCLKTHDKNIYSDKEVPGCCRESETLVKAGESAFNRGTK